MSKAPRHGLFSLRGVFALLIGAVLVPTVFSISVGIVALALWEDAADIVVGVLTTTFAALVVGGAIGTIVLLHKWNRLARLQADFMANMSHELNTPLSAIRLFVETLRYGRAKTPEEVTACLDALAEETDRLSTLIQRILRARRIEAGENNFLRKIERIEEIVADALRPLRVLSTNRRTPIILEAQGQLPPVLADRRAVAEAIRNVVHNALTYGGSDTTVRVTLRATTDQRQVEVEVEDQGPGIAPAEQRRVFDRFYRGEQVQNDASLPGTGLGLNIARQIIRAHGGAIQLDSQPGQGTRVTLRLPALPHELTEPEQTRLTQEGARITAANLVTPSDDPSGGIRSRTAADHPNPISEGQPDGA